MPVVLTKKSST